MLKWPFKISRVVQNDTVRYYREHDFYFMYHSKYTVLSCTVSKMKRDIDRKLRIFPTVAANHRKIWGLSPSSEEYPRPLCPCFIVIVQASNLSEKGNYIVISQLSYTQMHITKRNFGRTSTLLSRLLQMLYKIDATVSLPLCVKHHNSGCYLHTLVYCTGVWTQKKVEWLGYTWPENVWWYL